MFNWPYTPRVCSSGSHLDSIHINMRTTTLASVVPLLLPLLAQTAHAVCGIHSFTSCDDNIVHWFDPLTGEVCDPVDCGGGRAPPKTGPGCPGYTGTAVLSVSYLSCWTPSSAAPPSTLATSTAAADGTPSITSTGFEATPTRVITTLAQPSPVTDGGSLTTPSPSPTPAPTVFTDLSPGAGGAGTGGTTAQPQPTTNAGNSVGGPWRAALGAVIGGVIALV